MKQEKPRVALRRSMNKIGCNQIKNGKEIKSAGIKCSGGKAQADKIPAEIAILLLHQLLAFPTFNDKTKIQFFSFIEDSEEKMLNYFYYLQVGKSLSGGCAVDLHPTLQNQTLKHAE